MIWRKNPGSNSMPIFMGWLCWLFISTNKASCHNEKLIAGLKKVHVANMKHFLYSERFMLRTWRIFSTPKGSCCEHGGFSLLRKFHVANMEDFLCSEKPMLPTWRIFSAPKSLCCQHEAFFRQKDIVVLDYSCKK